MRFATVISLPLIFFNTKFSVYLKDKVSQDPELAPWVMSQERDKGWGSSEDPVGTHSPKGAVEGASMAQTAGDCRRPFPQYLEALSSWTLA